MVTYRRGGKFGPRVQPNFQLVVVHRGSADIWVDGQKLSLKSNWAILLRPGRVERFEFSRTQESRHSWCQIAPHLVPATMKFPESSLLRPAICGEAVFEQIKLGLNSEVVGPAATALVLSTIWAFCGAVGQREPVEETVPGTVAERFQNAVERLLAEEVSLADLAREAGASRGHLIKVVREKWSTTPMEVLWRQRTDAAAQLLRETGLTIGEVAARTGFSNPYHLSRRFRQQFGLAPRAWRMRCWNPKR
ncbi:N/A [soil metagenome]